MSTLAERAAAIARDANPCDGPTAIVPLLALLVEAVERLAVAVERAKEKPDA